MSKTMVALITAALALTGCGNLTGPDERDAAANAAKAKQALEAGSQAAAISARLSSN